MTCLTRGRRPRTRNSLPSGYTAAKARFAAGVVPLADQVQADTAYAQATLRHLQAEGWFAGNGGDLTILTGVSLESAPG